MDTVFLLILIAAYCQRSLNPKNVIKVGLSRLGAQMTMSNTIKLYHFSKTTVTLDFREMERYSVPAVTRLLHKYLCKFVVTLYFNEDDMEH